MTVDEPTDHRVQENDESGAQGRDEEEELLPMGHLLGGILASGSNQVEHCEGRETHCSINLRSWKAFEGVDDHPVGGRARIKARDAHHTGDLTNRNVQGRTRHIGRDRHQRD